MATVTIGKPYFDALLRRAEFHTSGHQFDTTPSLFNNVTISKAEHDYLLQAEREYGLLKSALFRGGLTIETLNTLLVDEHTIHHGSNTYTGKPDSWNETFVHPQTAPVTISRPQVNNDSHIPDDTTVEGGVVHLRGDTGLHNGVDNYVESDSIGTSEKEEGIRALVHHVPVHDQRTVLVTNLSDRTTHKDLAGIAKGGRLLDIFLRNDRSATISFVEGAAEFLAYAKRNDIYLHTKRLEFRWNDRQFHVPPHVANKIANGASRNLVVRGALGKLTADQIRDHLDHIHNLVVVDIAFKDGDAYISTNSIHNALFARTCMMSRGIYKGLRIEWWVITLPVPVASLLSRSTDECSAPLPRSVAKVNNYSSTVATKTIPITNRYTLLDTGSDEDSGSDTESNMASGIRVSCQWADTAVA